ncbi:MAG: prolyl oligopeptidase family serine peptidase [Polyangiales bacterium]
MAVSTLACACDASHAAPPGPASALAARTSDEDPYLWLEDVTGERALSWVRERNTAAKAALESDAQQKLEARLRAIYDSDQRLPFVTKRGDALYNFWQDATHVRGLLRRTTLGEYRKKEPVWETVLDLDALAEAEQENWIYAGISWLRPRYDRALLSLSRGGGDAVVVRELDVRTKAFVPGGFTLPEAKSDVSWKDADTVYVGTDFGPGSLTSSGYPRIAKEWRRGTPLSEARTLFEGAADDVAVSAYRDYNRGKSVDVVHRATTFYDSEILLVDREGKGEKLRRPRDVDVAFFDDYVLFRPRTAWLHGGTAHAAGSLLAAKLADFRAGDERLSLIYAPTTTSSLEGYGSTESALLLNVLEDVHTKVYVARPGEGGWSLSALPGAGLETVSTGAYDHDDGDAYWFQAEDFISPAKVSLGELGRDDREVIRAAPAFFDASGLEVTQHFATSKDGTRVPYYQVAKKDLAPSGDHPVFLTGYGGFEISLTPGYAATTGAAWLERGGVFVQANIRGGGEYGPTWHEAALKRNRQRSFDDFIAVAEDLIARKVTQPKRLGIQGGSNGGLLMGVMLTQRPDLFGAIVCSVPLLDMKRYHLLLAGASWMAEYGDPDDAEDWAAIAAYSPYQNVRPGVRYPRVLFTTSTRDDRVHPGHARKMVARMLDQGHDVLYFENTEGGHAGAANNAQRAYMSALEYAYLYQQLMH